MTTRLPKRQHKDLEAQIQSQLCSFGARLRELRLQRGWTLEELACRSSLSKAFLSRLESGGRQASIAAALSLSRIFDVSLASLFESQLATEPCVIVRAADAGVKKHKRAQIHFAFECGAVFQSAAHQSDRALVAPGRGTLPPRRRGMDLCPDRQPDLVAGGQNL